MFKKDCPDFTITPMRGIIPANSFIDIDILYSPLSNITVDCDVEVCNWAFINKYLRNKTIFLINTKLFTASFASLNLIMNLFLFAWWVLEDIRTQTRHVGSSQPTPNSKLWVSREEMRHKAVSLTQKRSSSSIRRLWSRVAVHNALKKKMLRRQNRVCLLRKRGL